MAEQFKKVNPSAAAAAGRMHAICGARLCSHRAHQTGDSARMHWP